jgi:16S rRNA (guanine527-N7)-methyltransferase
VESGIQRLRAVLAEHGVSADEAALGRLALYLELVAQYSQALSLTGFSLEGPLLAAELVGEALRLLRLDQIAPATHVVDLGSGNGSPVIPLAALCPEGQFTAVEVRQRRAEFLRLVSAKLGLENLSVDNRRVEELAREQPRAFQLVTSRAFAPPGKLLPLASLLLAPGGELRGYLGADADALTAAAAGNGFTVDALERYTLGESTRHVYLLRA